MLEDLRRLPIASEQMHRCSIANSNSMVMHHQYCPCSCHSVFHAHDYLLPSGKMLRFVTAEDRENEKEVQGAMADALEAFIINGVPLNENGKLQEYRNRRQLREDQAWARLRRRAFVKQRGGQHE